MPTSPLGRSALLILLYLVCGALFAVAFVRALLPVVGFVRGDRSAGRAVIAAAAAAVFGIVLALVLRGLGTLRARWDVDLRRPRVHRSTFDV